jgi:hypothetical protein
MSGTAPWRVAKYLRRRAQAADSEIVGKTPVFTGTLEG